MTDNISRDADRVLSEDMMKLYNAENITLTERQALFVYYYVLYGNGYKAAKLAGYSENALYFTAYENLRKPNITLAISLRKKQIAEENKPTHEYLVNWLRDLADLDLSNLISVDLKSSTCVFKDLESLQQSGIGKYIDAITVGKRGITVKLVSKGMAAEMLAKHSGLFELDNTQKKAEAIQFYIPDNSRTAAPETETPAE